MTWRTGMHQDEFQIDTTLVRRLLARSVPHLADRPVRRLGTQGSTNALFRLGDDLLVRLPRQPGGSATIAKEFRWLPSLAEALPVDVPEVVAVGPPGPGYPESWSIVRWLPGRTPEPVAHKGALHGNVAGELAAIEDEMADYLTQCQDLPLDLDLDACARI